MFRIVTATALIAAAAPALAAERAHSPQQVHDALKAGCVVQNVHTPAGKGVHQSPLIHCTKATPATARVQSKQPAMGSAD